MGYKVITPVAAPVIPLETLRAHLRLDMLGGITHPDDALILIYLADARKYAEHYTQRSIGVQTVELALDAFPAAGIELPLGADAIVSIKYVDSNLDEQTIASNLYSLDNYGGDHWAIPVDVWPSPASVANAVKVRYTTPSNLSDVFTALLLLTTHWYENRAAVNTDRGVNPGEVPLGVKALLDTFRKWGM